MKSGKFFIILSMLLLFNLFLISANVNIPKPNIPIPPINYSLVNTNHSITSDYSSNSGLLNNHADTYFYQASNPLNFITSTALAPYLLISDLINSVGNWSRDKPNYDNQTVTASKYYNKTQVDSNLSNYYLNSNPSNYVNGTYGNASYQFGSNNFNGSGGFNTTGTLGAGATTVTSLTDSGLTSGRIPYASTGGLLIDSANFLFDGQDQTFLTGRGFILSDTSNTRTIKINYNYDSTGSSLNYIDFRAGETSQGCGFEMIPGSASGGRGSTMFLYALGRPIVDANWERAQIQSKFNSNPTGLVLSWGKGGTGVMRDIQIVLGVTNTFNVIGGTAQSANLQEWQDVSYNILSSVSSGGNFGIRMATAPSAYLHLGAGTATAGTAPLKFTSGTLLTTAENGSMEYDGTNYYLTNNSNSRFKLLTNQSGLTGTYQILKDVDLVGLTKTYCNQTFNGGLLTSTTC